VSFSLAGGGLEVGRVRRGCWGERMEDAFWRKRRCDQRMKYCSRQSTGGLLQPDSAGCRGRARAARILSGASAWMVAAMIFTALGRGDTQDPSYFTILQLDTGQVASSNPGPILPLCSVSFLVSLWAKICRAIGQEIVCSSKVDRRLADTRHEHAFVFFGERVGFSDTHPPQHNCHVQETQARCEDIKTRSFDMITGIPPSPFLSLSPVSLRPFISMHLPIHSPLRFGFRV